MSVEIEARFSSPKGELMLIAWFEGEGVAHLVMTGPGAEREELEVKGLNASLHDEARRAMREAETPAAGQSAVTVRLQLVVDGARAGRTTRMGNPTSRVEQLCGKLVQMADLLAKADATRRALKVLRGLLKV